VDRARYFAYEYCIAFLQYLGRNNAQAIHLAFENDSIQLKFVQNNIIFCSAIFDSFVSIDRP
jgi:hypothetical protein